MKKIITTLLFVLSFAIIGVAQAPQGFKYQAVARNASSEPYANTQLRVRLSILQNTSATGTAYIETHNVITSDLGVFNLNVGRGTAESGSFSTINWGSAAHYLKIEISTDDGLSYNALGTTQLLSVPYALYANQAGSGGGSDGDNSSTNELQTLTYDPTTNQLSISNGNSVTLPAAGTPGPKGDKGDKGDTGLQGPKGDPGNPSTDAQTLNLTGNQLSISNGNTVALPILPSYAAGTGINIIGNMITNTGDTNAADDLTNTSISDGDLTGTFSNLSIKPARVGTLQLSNNSITSEKLTNLGATTAGQVLQWNGTQWQAGSGNNSSNLWNNNRYTANITHNILEGSTVLITPDTCCAAVTNNAALIVDGGKFKSNGAIVVTKEASDSAIALQAKTLVEGNFNPIAVSGTSLPSNVRLRDGVGFGIGGKFVGGNRGIVAELRENQATTVLPTLATYDKYYGSDAIPTAGYFSSTSSVGLMSTSFGSHQFALNTYGIGIVGNNKSNADYSIGVLGTADSTADNTRIGLMGVTTQGRFDFNAIGVMGRVYDRNNLTEVGNGIGGFFEGSTGLQVYSTYKGIDAFTTDGVAAVFTNSPSSRVSTNSPTLIASNIGTGSAAEFAANDSNVPGVKISSKGSIRASHLLLTETGSTQSTYMQFNNINSSNNWRLSGHTSNAPVFQGRFDFEYYTASNQIFRTIISLHEAGRLGVNRSPQETLDVLGGIRASSVIYSTANNAKVFQGGDDFSLWDINQQNTMGVYGQQNSATGAILLGSTGAKLTGINNELNIEVLGRTRVRVNRGGMNVFSEAGNSEISQVIINNNGTYQGWVIADVLQASVKNFRMDHPNDPNKEIWYACIEGPEAAAYERGTATLNNGERFIEFSEHFAAVANAKSMTVILTPLYTDTYGLAIVEKTDKGFKVKELKSGSGNFSFDWEVKCVRKGYEDYKPVMTKKEIQEKYRTSQAEKEN